jgi:hypothetical protein
MEPVRFGPWRMFAPAFSDRYWHFGTLAFVKLHYMSHPIVEVVLTVDPEGPYWGWLRAGAPAPTMIWPSWMQLDMCFPGGAQVEEELGRGLILRLSARPVGEE